MSRQYVILTADEVENINFDDVLETSADTLRRSSEGKTFVKFEGDTPSWLAGKPTMTQAEILTVLNAPDGEWYVEEPE
tara:strand:- start:21660 stop:21893 length:234 start_codon:yes stop_codon:yes gene_type:complete